MYATSFRLRAVSSTGTVLATFKEMPGGGKQVSLPAPLAVWIEDEDINIQDTSCFMGHKQVVVVEFTETDGSIVILPDPATSGTPPVAVYSSLQAVINALPARGTLEYSLDDGTTWIPCRHDDPGVGKLDGFNEGNSLALTLTSRAIVAAPMRTS